MATIKINELGAGTPVSTDLVPFADPTTGLAEKATITQIATLIQPLLTGKADLNGDSTETFEVADATSSTEAVNKGQLDVAIAGLLDSASLVDTIADLRLMAQPNANDVIFLLGYYSKGDKPIICYRWDNTSTETDNGGDVIKITAITTGRWIGCFDYANVKDFGAKGDYDYDLGTGTDDAAAFQNAIDSKPNRASDVIIPYGNYKIESALELGQSTSIRGIQTLFPEQVASPTNLKYVSQTALFFTNNTDGFTTLTTSSVSYRSQGIQLKNFGVFGGGIGEGKTALKLIENTNSTASFVKIGLPTIQGCYFHSWDICVNGSGTDSANYFQNHFSDCRIGVSGGLSETTFSNNVFYDITETALVINGQTATVSENEFEPTTTTGQSILVTGSAKNPRIVDNHFKKGFNCIEIDSTTTNLNCIITDNSFIENSGDKYIYLNGTNNIDVKDNAFESTNYNTVNGSFIYIDGCNDVTINNNLFTKNTGLIDEPIYINNTTNYQAVNNHYAGFTASQEIPTITSSTAREFKVDDVNLSGVFSGDLTGTINNINPISQSWANSYIDNYRERLLTDGFTYFPNSSSYDVAVNKYLGIYNKTSIHIHPSGSKTSLLPAIKGLDLDFVRGTNGSYIDQNGDQQTASTNEPRITYDANGNEKTLFEPSRTNLFLNSTTGATQTITVVASSTYAVSFSGTGTITFSGGATGSLVGTGSRATDRVSTTITPSTTSVTCTITGTVEYVNFELGSYSTSWIETTGTTATRNAESCTKSGLTSYINSEEGVFVAKIRAFANDGTNRRITLSDGTNNNRVVIGFSTTTNQLLAFVVVGGTTVATLNYNSSDVTVFNSVALKWKENDFAFWVNGVEQQTDLSGSSFSANTLTTLKFEGAGGGLNFYGEVERLKVCDEALTDEQLAIISNY